MLDIITEYWPDVLLWIFMWAPAWYAFAQKTILKISQDRIGELKQEKKDIEERFTKQIERLEWEIKELREFIYK